MTDVIYQVACIAFVGGASFAISLVALIVALRNR